MPVKTCNQNTKKKKTHLNEDKKALSNMVNKLDSAAGIQFLQWLTRVETINITDTEIVIAQREKAHIDHYI